MKKLFLTYILLSKASPKRNSCSGQNLFFFTLIFIHPSHGDQLVAQSHSSSHFGNIYHPGSDLQDRMQKQGLSLPKVDRSSSKPVHLCKCKLGKYCIIIRGFSNVQLYTKFSALKNFAIQTKNTIQFNLMQFKNELCNYPST